MPWGDGTGPPWGSGPGTGRGMGRGRRMGIGGRGRRIFSGWSPPQRESAQVEEEVSREKDFRNLKEEFKILKEDMDALVKRIDELIEKESTANLKATVDKDRCIGCGICVNLCPQKAIRME